MKRWSFLIGSLSLSSFGFSAQEPEYPFNIDVEVLWAKRDRTRDLDLVDYNGPFCSCECSQDQYTSANLIDSLDRTLGYRVAFNIRNQDKGVMELRGITPLDFSQTKRIQDPSETNVSCELAYGYNRVSVGEAAYTPRISVEAEVEIVPIEVDGEIVNQATVVYSSDYIEADSCLIHYKNSYWTAEANYWSTVSPRWKNYFSVSFGFGLRYFYIQDYIQEQFYKSDQTSFFSSAAKNDLFAGQVLFDFHIHPYNWLDWGIRLDGGVGAAHMKIAFELNDENSQVLLARYTRQKLDCAFYGDLEVFLDVKLLERGYLLFSYGGTLIQGMAQAIPNINLTTQKFSIATGGNLLYQYWAIGAGIDF